MGSSIFDYEWQEAIIITALALTIVALMSCMIWLFLKLDCCKSNAVTSKNSHGRNFPFEIIHLTPIDSSVKDIAECPAFSRDGVTAQSRVHMNSENLLHMKMLSEDSMIRLERRNTIRIRAHEFDMKSLRENFKHHDVMIQEQLKILQAEHSKVKGVKEAYEVGLQNIRQFSGRFTSMGDLFRGQCQHVSLCKSASVELSLGGSSAITPFAVSTDRGCQRRSKTPQMKMITDSSTQADHGDEVSLTEKDRDLKELIQKNRDLQQKVNVKVIRKSLMQEIRELQDMIKIHQAKMAKDSVTQDDTDLQDSLSNQVQVLRQRAEFYQLEQVSNTSEECPVQGDSSEERQKAIEIPAGKSSDNYDPKYQTKEKNLELENVQNGNLNLPCNSSDDLVENERTSELCQFSETDL